MGNITEKEKEPGKEKEEKPRIVKVRFGEPINPPDVEKLDEFEMGDFLLDISRLMMCEIAALLPPGQRGDFEDVDEKLREVQERLHPLQTPSGPEEPKG